MRVNLGLKEIQFQQVLLAVHGPYLLHLLLQPVHHVIKRIRNLRKLTLPPLLGIYPYIKPSLCHLVHLILNLVHWFDDMLSGKHGQGIDA